MTNKIPRSSNRSLNPIDDKFFRKMAEEREFCEEILRVILDDPGLKVLSSHPQEYVTNLKGRSVQLDAVCKMSDGRIVNVEVQKYSNEDHQRRIRYHEALLTANNTTTGADFSDIVDVCIIYIAKFDIFGKGMSVYHVNRVVQETGEKVYNGVEEIYVNAEVRDGTPVSELMRVFTEDTAYSDKFPVTSELKQRYKEGDPKMLYTYRDELLDIGRAEGEAKGRAEGEAKGRAEGRMEGEAKGRAEEHEKTLQVLKLLNISEEDYNKAIAQLKTSEAKQLQEEESTYTVD